MARAHHTGPKGRCRDCGTPLDIRCGSLVGKRKEPWSAHPELVAAIYRDVRDAVCTLRPVMSIRCPACRALDPQRLIWLGLEGAEGDAPDGRLGGPFCNRCVERALCALYESPDGASAELPVYYLRVTPVAAHRIHRAGAPPSTEEDLAGEELF